MATLLRDKMRDEDAPDRQVMADRVIEQLIRANPDSAQAYLFQAQYLANYQSRDKARPAVEKALELAPDDAEVLLHAAELYLGAKEFDKAAPLVEKGIAKYPKDWRFYKAGVMLADEKNDPAEAKRMLAAGLETLPRDLQLLYLSFDRQLRERDFEAARDTLKKLTYYRMRPELCDYSQARLLVAEGKMREASQILEPLQANTAKNPQLSAGVDALMVQCYTVLNQPDRVLSAANRIQNLPEGQIGKAIAEMSLGQNKKALDRFQNLAKQLEENKQLANMPQFYGPIFQLQISEELQKPKDKRDWKEADELLAKLREQNLIKDPALSLMEISLLSAKEQKPQAQQLLDELRKKYPNDVAVLIRAVSFALQDPNNAQAADRAMQMIESAPAEIRNHPVMISGRIEATLLRGGKREELLQRLGEIAPLAEKLPTNESRSGLRHVGYGLCAHGRQSERRTILEQGGRIAAARIWNSHYVV